MPFEAKLAGDVKLFRLMPPDDFPPTLIRLLLIKRGFFLFNLRYQETLLGVRVPLSIGFDTSVLSRREFHNLAKHVVTKTRRIIGPKSRDLLTTRISDFLKSCFHFHKVPDLKCFTPSPVFMVDILLDLKKYVEDGDHHDGGKGELDNLNVVQSNNIDEHTLFSIGASNIYHASLEPEDVEILQLWLSRYIKDFRGLKHVEITQDTINKRFLKVKPTLKLVQSKELSGDIDMVCSICLDNFSTDDEDEDEDNTLIMLPRCKHVFHSHCLFKWLPNKPLCPYCRTISLTPMLID